MTNDVCRYMHIDLCLSHNYTYNTNKKQQQMTKSYNKTFYKKIKYINVYTKKWRLKQHMPLAK